VGFRGRGARAPSKDKRSSRRHACARVCGALDCWNSRKKPRGGRARVEHGLARAAEPAARTIAAMDDESMPREEQSKRRVQTYPWNENICPASAVLRSCLNDAPKDQRPGSLAKLYVLALWKPARLLYIVLGGREILRCSARPVRWRLAPEEQWPR